MQSPGRVFSRDQLLDGVWGTDVYVDERTVDVHIGRLRKALLQAWASDPIRTVRGAGYSFEALPTERPAGGSTPTESESSDIANLRCSARLSAERSLCDDAPTSP